MSVASGRQSSLASARANRLESTEDATQYTSLTTMRNSITTGNQTHMNRGTDREQAQKTVIIETSLRTSLYRTNG